jgi:methylenetetrahydrofolate reductase (NADPH)
MRRARRKSRELPTPIGRRACAISSRCAVIRRSRRARFEPHPEGYAGAAELVEGLKRAAVRDFGQPPIPKPTPTRERASRSRQPQAQDRCRRDPRDHAILLRRPKPISASVDKAAAAAGITAESCPASCRSATSPCVKKMAAMCNTHRCRAGWARLFEGLDDSPPRASWSRRPSPPNCAAALCGRRAHFHFYTLNRAELSLCDLPSARACARKANE